MRFWGLGKRNLKELYRDPLLMGFLIGMPLVFIFVFGWAFSGEMDLPSIGVVQEDESPQAAMFVKVLLKDTEDTEANLPEEMAEFSFTLYTTRDEAVKEIEAGELTGSLIIPEGFGEAIETEDLVPLEVLYDQNDTMAAPRVIPIVEKVALFFLGVEALDLKASGTVVGVKNEFMNFFIPGMTVYGLMILVPSIVAVITRDKEKGFLSRMLTLPLTPSDFILGYSLPFLPVIAVQILIYIGVGIPMELKIIGNFGLAFLLFYLTGLICVAIAMIVGSFVKTEAQSAICWIVLVPLAMLSGAFFSAEMMPDILVRIMDVFPFTHALDASRSVVTTGASFGDILPDFYWLVGWTVALFAAGTVLFRRSMARV